MWNSGIQGEVLEVTVVGCNKLKDTEWISRQDPYVCLEYGTTKYRTRTNTDGGKNPMFQEKFVFRLIEGLRELDVVVWNSNTITYDDLIGTGKIQLHKVLTQGFDDTSWTIHTKTGRYAGEVRLILHYSRASKPTTGYAPSAPPYGLSHSPQVPQYPMAPPSTASYGHPPASYPASSPYHAYPPPPSAYPPPPSPYPPAPPSYTPPYAPPPSAYPPTYPHPYPPSEPSNYPPGSYHGAYPRPPY